MSEADAVWSGLVEGLDCEHLESSQSKDENWEICDASGAGCGWELRQLPAGRSGGANGTQSQGGFAR